jgi:hypothetical protein
MTAGHSSEADEINSQATARAEQTRPKGKMNPDVLPLDFRAATPDQRCGCRTRCPQPRTLSAVRAAY